MTKQEIQKEYNKFKVENSYIKTCSDLNVYALDFIEDIEDSIKEYRKELKENIKMKKEANTRNLLFFIFQKEDTSFYDSDNDLIRQIIEEMTKQIGYIKRIIELISEQNKNELLKLLEFLIYHYSINIDYLEKERERLEFSIQNIYFSNNIDDNREGTNIFIEEMLNKYEINTNIIEKTKKI